MDRLRVRQVPEGSRHQGKMEKNSCEVIFDNPMTCAVQIYNLNMRPVSITGYFFSYHQNHVILACYGFRVMSHGNIGLDPAAWQIDPAGQKHLQFGLFSIPTIGPQLVHQRLWYVLSCL